MCTYIEKIQTKTKFVILMHPKEFKKVKNNTGRFTHLSLPNSELFIGVDFTKHRRINEIIQTHQSYILFPSDSAHDLSKEPLLESSKPYAIFLIDSTWACTKSIFRESRNLQTLPFLSFTTDKTSRYEIKEQPESHFLSTMESTQVVLELLVRHGIEQIEPEKLQNFLRPFEKMVAYQKSVIQNPKSHAVRFRRNARGSAPKR